MSNSVISSAIFAVFSWVQANAHGETQKQDWVGGADVLRALRRSIWAVLMPPVVMGGIYLGIFTATEAAAIGAVYAPEAFGIADGAGGIKVQSIIELALGVAIGAITFTGSVIAPKCLPRCGVSAPVRSIATLRFARPVAIA